MNKCCAKCEHFDSSNGFCRCQPPTFVITEGGKAHSMYPKPALPQKDYCGKFVEKSQIING